VVLLGVKSSIFKSIPKLFSIEYLLYAFFKLLNTSIFISYIYAIPLILILSLFSFIGALDSSPVLVISLLSPVLLLSSVLVIPLLSPVLLLSPVSTISLLLPILVVSLLSPVSIPLFSPVLVISESALKKPEKKI